MEPDFSGYATKAGLVCSDGRTIMPGTFRQQDQTKVPLVWQHNHSNPENVLGHAILEAREDGIYTKAFFNKTPAAQHMKESVEHGDITQMSIYANELMERGKRVMHGVIREVSLVLSGANPGALIDYIAIRHGDDGEIEYTNEDAIIFTGLEIMHSSNEESSEEESSEEESSEEESSEEESSEEESSEEESSEEESSEEESSDDQLEHADGSDETLRDIFDTLTEKQKNAVFVMLEQVATNADMAQDSLSDTKNLKGDVEMGNVFEDQRKGPEGHVLSHEDAQGIVADAIKRGSLKEAVEAFQHGIGDIDILFPDAVAVDNTPEFLKRRTEWVAGVLGGARKSPFSRIKTFSADITEAQARAKGYIKGTLKKEEFFRVARRVTTPATIYKKQKLDRDDLVDITDFDVVAWLKSEMRLMLDEEIARAILVGDGRDIADEDKINEQNIRPIASDHELFTTTINVNIGDASSSVTEVIDAIVKNRSAYKGTGLPTMFTTETVIAQFLLLKDTLGRYIYDSLDQVATKLRVQSIVPVEVMEETPEIVAILVNMADYTVGATSGGQVSLFDDFDIDYNQYKYLIETRMCGALHKLKSAMVIRSTAAANVLITPTAPTFDEDEGEVTIINTANVVYKNADTDAVINAAGSPYAVASGETMNIVATPAAGYYFESSEEDNWSFTNYN